MKKYFFSFILIIITSSTFAQISFPLDISPVAWRVKQIDEFIERFNGNQNTFIKEWVQNNEPSITLNREKLIFSLFNFENKSLKIDDVKEFVKAVNGNDHPCFLDFFDDDWCAKLKCIVKLNGKSEVVDLTLKIIKFQNGSSKWVISEVNADFLKLQHSNDSLTKSMIYTIPTAKDSVTSLMPYSHAIGFMNINSVSKDKANIENYFMKPPNRDNDELFVFINKIVNGQLIIIKTTSLHYVFSHVKGWTFEVREFARETRNSGWLISKLKKLSE